MKISREFSNSINWLLDNLIPPVLRDSKWLMAIIMRIALGSKYTYYMDFKKHIPLISDKEIDAYYSFLSDTFINRKTDLNKKSISFILDHIVGNSVIDVGCGRGYLTNKIVNTFGNKIAVHGLDVSTIPRHKKGVSYKKGTILHLPYSDKSFDTVICTHVLEHIREINNALDELKRIASKRLIIVVPSQREYKYTFDLHIHFFPYLHNFQNLIKSPMAQYYKFNGDFICVEDLL